MFGYSNPPPPSRHRHRHRIGLKPPSMPPASGRPHLSQVAVGCCFGCLSGFVVSCPPTQLWAASWTSKAARLLLRQIPPLGASRQRMVFDCFITSSAHAAQLLATSCGCLHGSHASGLPSTAPFPGGPAGPFRTGRVAQPQDADIIRPQVQKDVPHRRTRTTNPLVTSSPSQGWPAPCALERFVIRVCVPRRVARQAHRSQSCWK